MDHFVVYGDSVIWALGMFLIEELIVMYPNINFTKVEVNELIGMGRLIENVKIVQKILYLQDIKADYENICKKIEEGKKLPL